MKYLHIIPPSSRMLSTYISFIEENFCNKDAIHHFISVRKVPKGEKALFEPEGRFELEGRGWKKVANLNRIIKKYDRVVWYSFIVPHRYALYLATHPRVCKKSVWVVWGMDIHNWRVESGSITGMIKNWAHKRSRRRFGTVICLEEADREKYRKDFSSKVDCICANLPMSKESLAELEELRMAKPRMNGKTFIQIEHNAHSFNNHLDIIRRLSVYDQDSFEYFIPLSYGTAKDWEGNPSDYIDQVVELAQQHFQSRAHPILSMMPSDTYTRMLWNMDIAVFGSDRQNGLGNILRMLYVGNKVFLPRENPTYQRLIEMGCEVGATEDLGEMPLENFLKMPSERSGSIVRDWIMKSYYPDNLVHMWTHVFKVVEKKESVERYETVAFSGEMAVRRPDTTGLLPRYKESVFNLKPYIWPKKNRALCNYVYVVGSDNYVARAFNVASHMKSGLYLKGVLYSGDGEPPCEIRSLYVGSLCRHFPFSESDYFIVMERDPEKRKSAIERLKAQGCSRNQLIASSSMIGSGVVIGDGVTIGQWSNINSDVVIGDDVYIGWGVYVGFGCVIEDGCIIEDGAWVKEGTTVARGTVVGSKSVAGLYEGYC